MSTVWPTPPKLLAPLSTSAPAPSLVRAKPEEASPIAPPKVSAPPETVTAAFSRMSTAPAPKS